MAFNSFHFLIFFPIVMILYWGIPHKYRWMLLLAASYYFYMSWDARFILLLLGDTLVTWGAGLLLDRTEDVKKRRRILTLALVFCFALLFLFKYLDFGISSLNSLLRFFSLPGDLTLLRLTLPVGISFFTFQAVSYVVDVYQKKVPAEKHFGIYAVFLSFFPQLVAGPIERTKNLLGQVRSEKTFDYEGAGYGLRLMLWGFFKKMVVADNLAPYVTQVYSAPEQYTGFAFILAMVFFSLQIYCDFSGYSDIAIGAARILGIRLMDNFRSPYFSSSIRELWGRWHISLSTWFRDYVYIPLGGNRKGTARTSLNLFITFLLSGLWHGANWTYVVWGGLHGAAQVLERLILPKGFKNKFLRILCIPLVFAFWTLALAIFRAASISDAVYVLTHWWVNIFDVKTYFWYGFYQLKLLEPIYLFKLGLPILLLAAYDLTALKKDPIELVGQRREAVQFIICCLLLTILLLLHATEPAEFVYFQF